MAIFQKMAIFKNDQNNQNSQYQEEKTRLLLVKKEHSFKEGPFLTIRSLVFLKKKTFLLEEENQVYSC